MLTKGFFFTFHRFLNSKKLFYLQDKKNIGLLAKSFFGFSFLQIQLKCIIDIRKDKIRFAFQVLLYFHKGFLVISKVTFHRVFESIIVSSFLWCGAWQCMLVRLLLVVISFFSFFSLSYRIKCMIVLFVLIFKILVLILFISYYILIHFIKVLFVCF